jgi:16S rRNA (guanine966-N2)-methyltransferase
VRVVGGSAGGIPLHVPKGPDLRPTMELVKNAIFSSLAESIGDARVLDLFAGAGSLGLEALSRGAASCVFVESDRRACASIRQNLEKTRLTGGEVVAADAMRWVSRAPAGAFELIFADPPYAKREGERDFTPELLGSEGLRQALTPGGIFVLEHLPGAELPLGDRWEIVRQKRYGATEVAFLRVK